MINPILDLTWNLTLLFYQKLFNFSEANKKLQDTNDHIQGMVDMPSLSGNSPMPMRRPIANSFTRDDLVDGGDGGDGLGGELQKLEKMFR